MINIWWSLAVLFFFFFFFADNNSQFLKWFESKTLISILYDGCIYNVKITYCLLLSSSMTIRWIERERGRMEGRTLAWLLLCVIEILRWPPEQPQHAYYNLHHIRFHRQRWIFSAPHQPRPKRGFLIRGRHKSTAPGPAHQLAQEYSPISGGKHHQVSYPPIGSIFPKDPLPSPN